MNGEAVVRAELSSNNEAGQMSDGCQDKLSSDGETAVRARMVKRLSEETKLGW